jgi:cation diffusion facilitator family transporter
MAGAERDAEHPYGHGRIETVGSAALGLILLAVAGGILWDGVALILAGTAPRPGVAALILAGVSIGLKEVLYRVTVRVGRRTGSDLLVANAWHHRSDALSSVAALLGVGGAMLGPTWLDPAAALVVAVLVGGVGVSVLRSAIVNLIDTAVPEELRREAESVARETDGVLEVHDLMTRRTGRGFHMEIHVEVIADQTVVEGHEIAQAVRDRMFDRFPAVLDVVVHVDPWPAERFDTKRRRDAPEL